ncbi:MAG TPA: ABC transporter substrate-binding protein, partial [Candidatus Limnocylindrales bacterium]
MADLGQRQVSRRTVLKGGAAVAALGGASAFIAACSSSSTPSPAAAASGAGASVAPFSPAASLGGTVHIGSYHTDPGEPDGQKAVDAAFTAATGIKVAENIVDHSTFQNQISNYLGGTPDTAYTWFSGFRMKFFADKGFSVPIDDVWATVKNNFSEGFAQAVVGNDGHVYGIPVDYYPWAVFYRKSVFADKGYKIPATWDDLKALCTKMQSDGLTPIAFADQEGWPAMGTFDIINLRLNGYDFHVGLMAGKEKWTDPKVTAVFQKWAEILPY